MSDLNLWQLLLVGVLFCWSGFVRSGLGFGGAALTLPLLLLIKDDPLVFLPIIAVHLLIFSSQTIYSSWGQVNWPYLRKLLLILAIPKLAGIAGLLSFSPQVMSGFIYVVTFLYALTYVFNYSFKGGVYIDIPLLIMGGYFSGASLIGAPLIVAVATRHLAPAELRTTLFVLWFVLVCVKMAAFVMAGVDLQLWYAIYLLPVAGIGHFLGLRFNQRLVAAGQEKFIRVIGVTLILICIAGFWKLLTIDS
ncbi:MAG: TSUP family transporter [Gammaproteobacteria bacterium]|nr:TSUP family transporter [Gammaproteobacteria bacterium]